MKRSVHSIVVCLLAVLLTAAMMTACTKGGDNNTPKEPEATPTATGTPTPTEVPATPTPSPNPLDSMTLKEKYKDDFMIGMAMPASIINNPSFKDVIVGNFNSMTFENETKPDAVLRKDECQKGLPETYTEPVINLSMIARSMQFAKENGIKVRFHTLIWHSQTPSWFFTVDYTPNGQRVNREVMLKRMESYIRQVMTYMEENYPGQIYCYDVVNEAIDPPHGDANGMRKDSPWYEVIGPDFMNYAFEYARKYAPEGVDLYYNDYNCYSKSQQIIECLRPIKEAGNIDGIGMQSHISTSDNVDRQIRGTAAKFTAEGYKVQLTELDIGMSSTGKNAEELQAMKYCVLFKKMQQAKQNGTVDIDCITIWGLYDGVSWRREESPLLYRFDGSKLVKKRAWYGAMQDPEIKAVEY